MSDINITVDSRQVQTAQQELQELSNSFNNAQKSAGVFEKAFQRAASQMARDMNVFNSVVKANQEIINKNLGVTNSYKSAEQSARAFTEVLRNQERAARQSTAALNQRVGVTGPSALQSGAGFSAIEGEIERLRMKYDQIYASSQVYERSLKELDRAHMLGVMNTKQHAAAVDALNLEYQQFQAGTATAMNRFNQAQMESQRGLNQFGMISQQVGYQVGDFLVQVQSGTNWMVAFGQQATQLAGLLTLVPGMLKIGVALSIIVPLVTALGAAWMRTRKETDEAEASVKELESAIKSIDKTLRDWQNTKKATSLGISVEELLGIKRIENAEEAVKKARENLEKALEAAQQPVTGLSPGAQGGIAILNMIRTSRAESGAEQAELELMRAKQQLADQLAKTSEKETLELSKKLELQTLYNQNLAAGLSEVQAMAQAQYEQEKAILQASLASESLTDEQRMAAEANLKLVNQTYELENAIRQAEAETKLLEGGMSAATIEALKFAGVDLTKPLSAAIVKAAELAGLMATIRNDDGRGSQREGRRDVGAMRSAEAVRARLAALNSTRDGGGGGGINEAESLRAEYDRLMGSMDPVLRATQEFNAQQKMLNEALAAGAINSKEFEVALAAIKQKLEEAKDPLRDFKAGLEDTLSPEKNYIKGLEALQSSLADFLFNPFEVGLDGMVLGFSRALQRMASEALAAGFMKMLVGGAFGAGGSVGSGIMGFLGFANGGVFSNGNVRAFANGGVVASPTNFPMSGNQVGLMGESGPEAIMPLKRASNGKLGVVADGASGAKSTKIINVLDSRIVGEYLNTPEGEEVIMNVMRRTGVV